MIEAVVLVGGVEMSHMRDETIVCARCGEPFTWSYGEQAYYQQHGLHAPKHCPACRPIRREKFRSSEMDHPPYAAPLPDGGYEWPVRPLPDDGGTAVSPPPNQPTTEPNWWDVPMNRYNLFLFILVLLAMIVLWFIVQMI